MRGKIWAHFMLWPATFLAWCGLLAASETLFVRAEPSLGLITNVLQIMVLIPLYVLAVFSPIVLYQAGKSTCLIPARSDRSNSYSRSAAPQRTRKPVSSRLREAAA
jgi:hypothetical protein